MGWNDLDRRRSALGYRPPAPPTIEIIPPHPALSSGRFSSASGADAAAPFSGPNAGPPFPGEDFVANLTSGISAPVNLADGASLVVISFEPDLAGADPTGAGPFAIKPLVAEVPAGLADHTLTALGANLGSVPSGSASISSVASVVTALPATAGGGLASDGPAVWTFALAAALGVLALASLARFAIGRRR